MRANYRHTRSGDINKRTRCFTEDELKEYLDAEWLKRESELYKAATKDVSAQILAVMFATLYKPPYNWKRKRLLEFKHNVESTFHDMTTGIFGKEFSTIDCIEFMKREFDIDFDAEVKTKYIQNGGRSNAE